ncbi:MAG: XRE family transcriptional regulator [Arthrobacter sp.]|uniref:helix-turn-helix domain-containing protein n=1 Tax=Arthrobacter sp. TaxID=1667 RepID=UPI00348B5278
MAPAIDPRLAGVGRRIRALRLAEGMSLSRLAAAAGIGKGTLSELERGERNPTLGTLYAVAGVLRLPLARLVDGGAAAAPSPGGVPRAPLAPGISDGTVTATLLEARAAAGGGLVEVYWLEIGPGRRVSPGHGPGVVEHLTLIEGTAAVGATGAELSLDPGETASWSSSGEHTYASATGAAGVLTIVNP